MSPPELPTEHDTSAAPSKTRRKQEALALQALGEKLVRLSEEALFRLDLPELLRAAVLQARNLRAHGALRRQMQYIGKLMRSLDADSIAAQLAVLHGESDAAKAHFHAIERWRDRLIDDDAALTDWLAAHPDSDAQHLRQLIRNARKEIAQGKPPRASRALFRVLRTTLEAAPDKAIGEF